MTRCAVLGSPIGHSLSPVLHREAYAALGLDWEYEAHVVTEDTLEAFLACLDGSWRGLSLTMPLKRAVLPLLDSISERARQAGGANTVVLAGGRRSGSWPGQQASDWVRQYSLNSALYFKNVS